MKLLGLLILSTFLSCSSIKSHGTVESFSVFFIDDFENNIVSLNIGRNEILSPTLFRKSDIPQLRNLHRVSLTIKRNVVERFYTGRLKASTNINNIDLNSIIELKLSVDNKILNKKIELVEGKYLIISYNQGEINIKQAEFIK